MSEASKAARKAMKAKISRITRTDPKSKVDASGYTPPDALDADVKTGLRPISRRQFRRGGKVFANEGIPTMPRADKKARQGAVGFGSEGVAKKSRAERMARATGGNVVEKLENRDVREINRDRVGSKHIGGFAKGGKISGPRPSSQVTVGKGRNYGTQRDDESSGENRRKDPKGIHEKHSTKATNYAPQHKLNGGKRYGEERDDDSARENHARGGSTKHTYKSGGGPAGSTSKLPVYDADTDGGGRRKTRATGGETNDDPEDSYGSPSTGKRTNTTSTQDPGGRTPVYGNPNYNKGAVDKAIASSNRSGRRISGKEAKAIHRLLSGRSERARGGRSDPKSTVYGMERDDESGHRRKMPHGSACKCVDCCGKRRARADGGRLGNTPGTTAYDTKKPTYWDAVKDRASSLFQNEDGAAPHFKNPIATGNAEQPYEGIGGAAREAAIMGAANGDPPPQKKRGGAVNIDKLTGVCRTGDREARARGGRAKGKTNINIIIGRGAPSAPAAATAGPMMPPGPPPGGAGLHQGVPPPMPPPGMPPGMPPAAAPMPRRSGGRVSGKVSSYAGRGYGTEVAEGFGFDRKTADGHTAPPYTTGGGGGLQRLQAYRRQGAKPKL